MRVALRHSTRRAALLVLAGRTLIAKLGATQDDGARQEPARAGRIRVRGL
jgi:hypothetical protein